MDPSPNPFAVLSLIVAPAILTNASSVLVMSTSNRLARAVDRARELSRQLEEAGYKSADAPLYLEEIEANERRAMLLLRGLRCFYASLGGFASATLISLLGAVLVPVAVRWAVWTLEVAGVIAGLVAVGGIVYGSMLLLRETRIAVQTLSRRADYLRQQASS
jgi:hypothetical protein